jgi:hypothetical protein
MTFSEAWRRETEARHWLAKTKGDPKRVGELLKRIAQKRGQAMADQLRADMRIAYQAARQIAVSPGTGAARVAGSG